MDNPLHTVFVFKFFATPWNIHLLSTVLECRVWFSYTCTQLVITHNIVNFYLQSGPFSWSWSRDGRTVI